MLDLDSVSEEIYNIFGQDTKIFTISTTDNSGKKAFIIRIARPTFSRSDNKKLKQIEQKFFPDGNVIIESTIDRRK